MAKHETLIFSGPDLDEHGLPKPFHRYEVYVAKWKGGGGVATVLTVTGGSPAPEPLSFISAKGRKQAFKLADDALRSLHPGLKRHRG